MPVMLPTAWPVVAVVGPITIPVGGVQVAELYIGLSEQKSRTIAWIEDAGVAGTNDTLYVIGPEI